MKLVCLSLLLIAAVFHEVHSGILLQKVGDTLEKIKCKTQSFGNRLFNRGQTHDLCDETQDLGPQGGRIQYNQFDHYNSQGVNGVQIWIPFTNRDQGSWGQQSTNYNGGYTNKPYSNNYYHGNNQDYGSVDKPYSNNLGYGNVGQSVPVEQGSQSTAKPSFNNVEYGYGQGSIDQVLPTNQNSGSTHGLSSSNGKISQPSSNNPYPDGKRAEPTASNISNQNVEQPQNCTGIDVRSDSTNQTGAPNNCTQGGRNFLGSVRANCAAGKIADKNGVCREIYRR